MKVRDYASQELAEQKIFSYIYEAQDKQIDKLEENIQDLLNQFFIETATWGLLYWEEEFGIKSNLNDGYEIRRSRLLAKKRGRGTTTKEVIKSICNSFVDNSDVIEHSVEYWFEVILESYKGFPYELNSLYEIVEEIKPAHLGAGYKLISINKNNFYIGGTNIMGEIITTYPWTPSEIENNTDIFVPMTAAYSGLETIITYPKEG
ncbi:MAG: putative phage tail protein [Clostridium butyricum]